MSITGGFGLGTNHYGAFNRGDSTWRENLTWIHGGHEFHFGLELVHLNNEIVNTYQMDGNFSFNGQLSGDGIADFILGRASQFSQGGGEFKDLRGNRWGVFVQDNWRVNQRLSSESRFAMGSLVPVPGHTGPSSVLSCPGHSRSDIRMRLLGLIYGGDNPDPGCPAAGAETRLNNFAPRLGFAYRVTNDGKTSVRGGDRLLLRSDSGERLQPLRKHRTLCADIHVQ